MNKVCYVVRTEIKHVTKGWSGDIAWKSSCYTLVACNSTCGRKLIFFSQCTKSMIWIGVQIYCKKSLLGGGGGLIKLHFMQAWGVEWSGSALTCSDQCAPIVCSPASVEKNRELILFRKRKMLCCAIGTLKQSVCPTVSIQSLHWAGSALDSPRVLHNDTNHGRKAKNTFPLFLPHSLLLHSLYSENPFLLLIEHIVTFQLTNVFFFF